MLCPFALGSFLSLFRENAKLASFRNPICVAIFAGPLLRWDAVTFYLAWHSCSLHVVDVFARTDTARDHELSAAFDKAYEAQVGLPSALFNSSLLKSN